ncbi:endonuclease/exonuclease/phosphatase family protein [Stenotrophomonas mori]|uniref:Endonuclease/exonuclease/phosphatase family protein n=1 Tax=Stenotrophomonas mori TaxID=2871096 RepID=A0ABT0SEQ1_9GAMM|nr:endonuclease/exonuclease/phosphatase family protein [Stenotrophomonas mori]MCL7713783.1 endonuclease/exonuclease/phosphatase family protein [Stenotrophomonas mori]
MADPVVPVLKVASLRLPPDAAQWRQQRERILERLADLRPDVIAVQDVQQSAERPNPACWLARRLSYSCDFITADPPSHALRRGNALLAGLDVLEDGITLLHGRGVATAAGMQRARLDRKAVNIYIVRIVTGDGNDGMRAQQAADLQAWIGATDAGEPSLIVGEFSAPTEELVRQLPGFQPARRNPSSRRERPAMAAALRAHGLDVLYQVRNFADVAQQSMELPAAAAGRAPERFGVMTTLSLIEPPPADPAGTLKH